MIRIPVFFVLVLLAACNPTPPKAFKTMMIRSSGEVETLPDEASFYIHLTCLENTTKASRDCLVKKSNELNHKLMKYGIDKDDLKTTAVEMERSYTWQNNSRVFRGYESSTRIFVKVRNLDTLSPLYTELLGNRNLDLSGLNYAHSKIDSLENEAYVLALKNARITAAKLAADLPRSDLEILKIGNVSISSTSPESSDFDDYVLYEAEMNIEPMRTVSVNTGTIKAHATIYVEFLMK